MCPSERAATSLGFDSRSHHPYRPVAEPARRLGRAAMLVGGRWRAAGGLRHGQAGHACGTAPTAESRDA